MISRRLLSRLSGLGTSLAALGIASAQIPPPSLTQIEPGLEKAVRWKWQPEPSDPRDWGLALRAVPILVPPTAPIRSPAMPQSVAPGGADSYTVKRGDALILISKRLHVPLALLKSVNGLTSDTIRVGQVLRIPSPEEIAAAAPKPTPANTGALAPPTPEQKDAAALILQVFLDRQLFSPGPITGHPNPTFERVLRIYQSAHPEIAPTDLLPKAQAEVGSPIVRYALRAEAFRFIAPPQAERVDPTASPTPSGKRKLSDAPVVRQPKPTYEQLTAVPLLAYRSPWEFVAERFHCDEAYLRKLNPQIPAFPPAGTEFFVPNVKPFEIEHALDPPVQPPEGAQSPVTAAVIDLSLLQIAREGKVIAVMPLSIARPGLRGRGAWTILNALPRPRLVSFKEPLVKATPPPRIYGTETEPTATPTPTPVPEKQILPAGPRNPVGIFWLNLAKADSPEPLPYGLTGTSIPDHMSTQQSLGGLRLTNWDIARAVRLLPPGTPLEWRQGAAAAAAPIAAPAR